MKVDFNNMRLQLARAFNNLTSELNDLQSDIDEPHYVQKEHLQKIADAATNLQNITCLARITTAVVILLTRNMKNVLFC